MQRRRSSEVSQLIVSGKLLKWVEIWNHGGVMGLMFEIEESYEVQVLKAVSIMKLVFW